MLRFFLNSLITLPSVVGVLVLATLNGFVLSRYRFPGIASRFALFVGGNFLPAQIMMIPVRDLMVKLGLYDTIYRVDHVPHRLPDRLCNAVHAQFHRRLAGRIVPGGTGRGRLTWPDALACRGSLVRPALAALAILTFTFVWNDYFWAIVFDPERRSETGDGRT